MLFAGVYIGVALRRRYRPGRLDVIVARQSGGRRIGRNVRLPVVMLEFGTGM